MLSAGYGAGALCYYTDTKVLKDAFNRDTGFGPDEKNAPGKTVASFNWRTYKEWGRLWGGGALPRICATPEQYTAESFTVPSGGYVRSVCAVWYAASAAASGGGGSGVAAENLR